jgi:hypothetical protein
MTLPQDEVFTVGRATLMNGATGTPFPGQIQELAGGRINISGVYHPEILAGESAVLRDARRLAFQQQWVGLNGEPDAVPVVSTKQPQLTGMYLVESASVDWVKSLTVNAGTVAYSAVLKRVLPASALAIHEVQYQTAKRSTATHAVTAAGTVWLPGTRTHTDYSPAVALTRNTIDGSDVTGGLVSGGGTAGTVGTIAFGIAADNFYQAACTVEIRHGGASTPWVAVQGTQIPNVPFYDLRISNGVNRFTWTDTDTSAPYPGGGTGKQIDLDHVIESGGIYSWEKYATKEIFATLDGFAIPIATPTILRNTPESVVIRYPVTRGASAFAYYTVSINRGDSFATLSTDPQQLYIWMFKTSNFNTALTGGRRSNATTNSYGWTLLSADPIPSGNIGLTGGMEISATSASVQVWAVGPYSSTVTVDADYTDLASQWWLAAGYTQRAVSL